MKIIRVTGCHACPYARQQMERYSDIDQYYICFKTGLINTEYYNTKTLPDNCPLEEEQNDQPKYSHNEAFEIARKLELNLNGEDK